MRDCRALFFFIIVFFWASKVFSVEIGSVGVPYVQNYPKSMYQFGNQNWSVTKDKKGVMYFGNSEGLLVFDGTFWHHYRMPNGIIIRAVSSNGSDRVYAGGFGEFGYWDYNEEGRFTYHSLKKLIPSDYSFKDEIWKIYIDGNRVIFQSFASIFIYENNKITVVKKENPLLFLLKAGSRFFVDVISEGLHELKGKTLVPVPGAGVLGNSGVLSVLPFKDNSYLIGTARNGLFIYDGTTIKRFESEANSFLTAYQLNNGSSISGKYFAFGSILNGVIIIDEAGKVIQQINKSSGLQNNTVLSMYTDDELNLWLGLDNGIDRIELNSPLYFYLDRTGKFGTVYSSIIYQGNIYLGTNQGLFYSKWRGNHSFFPFNFNIIDGSQGQVWDLNKIDDQLLCGHNEGTFSVQGESINKISDVKGGWIIKRLAGKPDFLIQGTYTGLVIFRKGTDGSWRFHKQVSGFGEPSRYVEEDNNGYIWVSNAYKGLYRLKLDGDFNVISTKTYSIKDGLPSDYNISLFNLNNNLLFATPRGFYTYDGITDKFHSYQSLNSKLGSFAYSAKIIKASGTKYWLIKHGIVTLVDIRPGNIRVDSTSFSTLNGRMVQHYENISRINKSLYLISVDDGFVIYDESKKHNIKKVPPILVRRIENITDSTALISESGHTKDQIEVAYNRANIRISYSMPLYRKANVKYQYMLEGYSDHWSDWTSHTQKDFTNLPPGNYTFLVRGKVDHLLTGTAGLKFVVLKPWYFSNGAILIYLIAAIALLLVLRRLYFKKLEKDQTLIQRRLEQEKEEELRREAIANEQKIVQIRNEQLQAELAGKSRELANSAMNIVYKNELLQKIRHELHELKDGSGKKLPPDQLRKIEKVLNEAMTEEGDWNLFEKSFNEAHENFFKRLKTDHKDLVPNDLKLCAYLRMNMNSKEIASLLNISLRGVEIRRYRLRKKLNVPHDKNLSEFLLEV